MFRHWRIIRTDSGRFQGGEWCDANHAYLWAKQQVRGPYVIVETDVYGAVKTPVQLEFGWN